MEEEWHYGALTEQAQVLPANCACSLLSCVSCRSASCSAAESCFRRSISFFLWAVSSSCSWETCAVAAANSSATLACITEHRKRGKKENNRVQKHEEAPELLSQEELWRYRRPSQGKRWDPAPRRYFPIEEALITFNSVTESHSAVTCPDWLESYIRPPSTSSYYIREFSQESLSIFLRVVPVLVALFRVVILWQYLLM